MDFVNKLPKVWVFDIDDTLYLESDYVRSGFSAVGQYMLETHGVSDFAESCWSFFVKGYRGNIFDQALNSLGINVQPRDVMQLVEVYRGHQPDISLSPLTYRALTEIQANYQLAIITGGPMTSQLAKVRALGLAELADKIVYAGQHGPRFDKPHPWAWQEIEDHYKFKGDEFVYFADNPAKDFTAPLDLGWRVIRVRFPKSEHIGSSTPKGVPEASSLLEAVEYIKKLNV